MSTLETMQELLLSYVSLLAERNAYGPDETFEYLLWDELHDTPERLTLASNEERKELISLAIRCDSWITYNDDTGMFQVIDIDAWLALLSKRGH